MSFIFPISTIPAWSGSDLFSKIGSRPDDKHSHLKMLMAVGLVMGIHAIWQVTIGGVEYSLFNFIAYMPVSAMYIISMMFGYIGLRYIELSISSPICNSSGALVAIMCFVFLGDTMSPLALLAVSSVLNALYYLPAIIRIWTRPDGPETTALSGRARTLSSRVAIAGMTALVFALGIWFQPTLRLLESAL